VKRSFLLSIVCIFSLIIVAQLSAQEKITGPWLIMVAPCEVGQGGANSIELDQIAAAVELGIPVVKGAVKDAVSEASIARDGANEGDRSGDLVWVEAEIPDDGDIQALIDANKTDWGGGWADLPDVIDDYSFYALINIESATDQPGVIMRTGSDDAIRVWLNGEVVFTNAVDRGLTAFDDEFEVNLNAGDNLLLVKVSERGGGWGVAVGIEADYTAAGIEYQDAPIPPAEPGDKIEGPWLWVTAPTTGGMCGATATETDWLAEASSGEVTEQMIADNGARPGDAVADKAWTSGNIAPEGDNNMGDLMAEIGLGDEDNTVAYGFTKLMSHGAKDTTMFVGSDDSVKVWLNGEVVWVNAVNRGASDFQENFDITLKSGDNLLLVAVYECGGGWSGFFGLAQDVGFEAVSVEPSGKLVSTWGDIKKAR
jgi:hypothetical protein